MFKKDILLVDIEATGTDVLKHEIIQLAAVLLDKKTLQEKASFTSYIKPKKWSQRSKEAMAVNGISWDELKDAPDMKTVLKYFVSCFPNNVTLAHYGGMIDIPFLSAAFRDAKIKYPYDYHVFDFWPIFYVYMAKQKRLKEKSKAPGFSLEGITKHFKVKVEGQRHDALTDCRIEAEVFRRLMRKQK